MRRWLFPLLMLWPSVISAQTDDRTYLIAFLEDNLSDIGRTVTISGFEGALSSQATIAQITLADADGVWLTLNQVSLNWNRAALFSGQVSVNALTAEEIIVNRPPVSDARALPSPEAAGFSLPELPVSIDIGKIAADRIVLGAPFTGQEVVGTFEASMALANGEGQTKLILNRTDRGPEGSFALTASYSNTSKNLILNLDANEAAGGIASTLLGVPGKPSAQLTIAGNGPVNDFNAAIALSTDSKPRLTGNITLVEGKDQSIHFATYLGGDLAPLFVPEYAKFFGPEVTLLAGGDRSADGYFDLTNLVVKTRALSLTGNLAIAADGLPERLNLAASLALPDGSAILLPLASQQETRVSSAELSLSFDSFKGNDVAFKSVINQFDRPNLKIDRLLLDGTGKIKRATDGNIFSFNTTYAARGLAPTDQALALAVGPSVNGSLAGSLTEDTGELRITNIDLSGTGLTVVANGTISGIASGFATTGQVAADVSDMERFSALAGRPLSGKANVKVSGKGSPLAGTFDLDSTMIGSDLRIGQSEANSLLKGRSQITASVIRSETGTQIKMLSLLASTLQAQVAGKIASTGSDLTADLSFSDLSSLGKKYRGALTAQASLKGTYQSGKIIIEGQSNDLAIGQADADKLLKGKSTLSAALDLTDRTFGITDVRFSNPQITAQASKKNVASAEIGMNAKLANLGLLLQEFPGPVTLSGTATQGSQGLVLALRAQGPGQINATLDGTLAKTGSADISIKGTGQAALANAFIDPRAISGAIGFNLRLKGPLQLSSLSGDASLSGGRITSPDLPFALQDTQMTATLSGGLAKINGQAAVSTGGQTSLTGTIALSAPNISSLQVGLRDVNFRDPQLYEARASGKLTIEGPLTGGALVAGQIDLGATEVKIPSGGLGALEDIPELRHIGEPAAVKATRARAGLFGADNSGGRKSSNAALGLNLTISAPSRVFIRGRGLDAELGGTLKLGGTTANVVPEGNFNLVRGRLDLLGKRLVLSEAQLRIEGDFVPFIRIAASTDNDGVTSTVLIEGLANDPSVTFASSPALPQEEVLSRLLFGRGLESLSAFQAAQLASAVANLAGKGGEGIVAKLRKGFGLDDLDLRTSDEGTASLRAGKYISRNTYTELEVDQTGKTQIQLNLDLTDSVTVRGRVGSDGDTGIGLFMEKDY